MTTSIPDGVFRTARLRGCADAGLHFTEALLSEVRSKALLSSVTPACWTGNLRSGETEALEQHVMHEEKFELNSAVTEAVSRTREAGGRVVAVGTTTLRECWKRSPPPTRTCCRDERLDSDLHSTSIPVSGGCA